MKISLLKKSKPVSAPLKAIIFDMGNVLLNYDARKAAERFSKSCKVPVMKIWVHFFTSQVEKAYTRGEISTREFFEHSVKALSPHLDFKTFQYYWNDIFVENPGMEPLLAKLKKKYPLYVLSNTNELHFDYIRAQFPNIFRHFKLTFPSHELGCRKPDRRIYEEALKRMGCRPQEAVFIDDVPKFVEGARKVGIRAIRFHTKDRLVKDLQKLGVKV